MKGPASQFYWSDWLRCAELRLCSFEARGLWIDMLAYMHQAKPYGHLVFNGKGVDPAMLAKMTGGKGALVTKLLKELKDNGVYSIDDNGVIYCRRMVRDELQREAWKHRQQAHRAKDSPPNPQNDPQNVTPQSQPSHADVTVGVTDLSRGSSVLPYFPSSKQQRAPRKEGVDNPRLNPRWWASERGIIEAGKTVSLTARSGESMEGFKRRIELEIARQKRDGPQAPRPEEQPLEGEQ